MDPLRIYVIFDPAFAEGKSWVKFLIRELGSLGMARDGSRTGVPIHPRYAPWGAKQPGLAGDDLPRRIDLSAARRNCVLILNDATMAANHEQWRRYVDHIRQQTKRRGKLDLVAEVLLPSARALLSHTQTIRGAVASLPTKKGKDRERTRFLVQLLNAILAFGSPVKRDGHPKGHGIFVSHAKRDGANIAIRIVETIEKVNEGLGPRCFFDADSLLPGEEYPQEFVEAIARGSLLAVVTDAYHARPWCRWEVLTAKRLGRPVVAVDLGAGRIERTYPYLGNVPSIRVNASAAETISDGAVEQVTRALLEEALRVELWRERAKFILGKKRAHLSIRPPELADLVVLSSSGPNSKPSLVLYPDPPLSSEEVELLSQAFPHYAVCTPSQLLT